MRTYACVERGVGPRAATPLRRYWVDDRRATHTEWKAACIVNDACGHARLQMQINRLRVSRGEAPKWSGE